MSDAKPKLIPMSTPVHLSRAAAQPKTDKPYSELLGAMFCLSRSICTCPDLTHGVGTLSRYMSAPSSVHWEAAKFVLCYVADTVDMGLQFLGGTWVALRW